MKEQELSSSLHRKAKQLLLGPEQRVPILMSRTRQSGLLLPVYLFACLALRDFVLFESNG